MTTLNNINTIFENIATAHLQINGFLIVQDFDINPQEDLKYPCLAINPLTALMPNENQNYSSLNVGYTVKVFDLVDKGLENENDVLSDTLSIIKDIIKFLNQNPAYYDANLNIIGDVSFNTIRRAFDEDVTGWETTFTLEFPAGMGYCGTPIDNVPTPPVRYVTITDALNILSPLEINPGGSYTCTPATPRSGIAYQRPQPTGVNVEYAIYDDFWQQVNNPYPSAPENPLYCQQLDLITDATGDTLLYDNFFGNKFRFTDDTGVEQNASASIYIIDNLTGIQYICLTAIGSHFWTFADTFGVGGNLDTVFNDGSFGGFTDWKIPNAKEWSSVFTYDYLHGTDLGVRIKIVNRNSWGSSTTRKQANTTYERLNFAPQLSATAKTNATYQLACRNYF